MDVFLNRYTQRVRENTRELSHEKTLMPLSVAVAALSAQGLEAKTLK